MLFDQSSQLFCLNVISEKHLKKYDYELKPMHSHLILINNNPLFKLKDDAAIFLGILWFNSDLNLKQTGPDLEQ